VVHWPLVLGVGVVAWLGVVGMVLAAWVLMPQPADPNSEAVAVVSPPASVGDASKPVPEKPIATVKAESKQAAVGLVAVAKPMADIPEDGPKGAFKEGPPERDGRLPPEFPDEKAADNPAPKAKNAQTCGTDVAFLDDPEKAFKKGKETQKVVFLVHVAGNFEDSQFT
jgi:hypothetical protein